jgi:hypothetical protein
MRLVHFLLSVWVTTPETSVDSELVVDAGRQLVQAHNK